MRTAQFENGRIIYPDEISFCFNLMLCKVATQNEVTCLISCEGVEFTDKRISNGGEVEIDLAMYARVFFTPNEGLITHKTVSVTVSTSQDSFYFSTNVIWGAMNGGEVFNGSRKITWFKKFPFTLSMYVSPGSTVYVSADGGSYQTKALVAGLQHINVSTLMSPKSKGEIKMMGGSFSTFSYQFDGTFVRVGDGTVINKLVVDESECGIYLRWLDRHGFYQYYLFTEGEKSEKSKNVGEKVSQLWSTDNAYYKSIGRFQKKNVTPSMRLCAMWVNDSDYEFLKTICSSPLVDIYMGGDVWVPVTVSDIEHVESQQPLRDFEIEIVLPDLLTQKL